MARVDFDSYSYGVSIRSYNTKNNAASISLFRNGKQVASLHFHSDASLANKDPVLSETKVTLYYHMSMLDTIIDMLRNEDSVFLTFNIDKKVGWMATGKEGVGEGET